MRIATVCRFSNPAHVFADIVALYPDWDASAILLFDDTLLERRLARERVAFVKEETRTSFSHSPALGVAQRIINDLSSVRDARRLYDAYVRDADVFVNLDSNVFAMGKWFARWARQDGKLVVRWVWEALSANRTLRNGIGTKLYLKALGFEHYAFFRAEGHSNVILVASDHIKDVLVRKGIPASRIAVVGSPDLSVIERQAGSSVPPFVLILSQPLGAEAERRIDEIVDVLLAKGAAIKVKLHPRDRVGRATELRARHPTIDVIEHGEERTNVLISEAKLVIGYYSTALQVALLLKKPTIFFEYTPSPTGRYYESFVRDFRLHTPQDLPELANTLAAGELGTYVHTVEQSSLRRLLGPPGFRQNFYEAIRSETARLASATD